MVSLARRGVNKIILNAEPRNISHGHGGYVIPSRRRMQSSRAVLPYAILLWTFCGLMSGCLWQDVPYFAVECFRSIATATRKSPVAFSSLHGQRISRIFSLPSQDAQEELMPTTASSTTMAASTTTLVAGSNPPSSLYSAVFNTTIYFPNYAGLMALQQGESISSYPFTVITERGEEFQFCVLLYPRGGGLLSENSIFDKNRQKGGFGMSYQIVPLLGKKQDENVGVYLQYLPTLENNDKSLKSSVDVSFALRMKGNQRNGWKFDVEWRAGMRFVPQDDTKLTEGQANIFGGQLMQTSLLEHFLGVDDADDLAHNKPVALQVELCIHKSPTTAEKSPDATEPLPGIELNDSILSNGPGGFLRVQDIRRRAVEGIDDAQDLVEHDTELVRAGRVVVPILSRLSQRPRLFQLGVYPGVEYRILRVIDPATGNDLFYSQPGCDYELKPIYPLVSQLERPWPVRVNEREIPRLYTTTMYNTISAFGSLATALTGLLAAFVISQAVSFFFIPSKSMDPTLQVGDVLLVDKVTPRLLNLVGQAPKTGNIVLFHPPDQLQAIVAKTGGRLSDRDLFVKRVAAEPGDTWSVGATGTVLVNGQALEGRRDFCQEEPLRLIEKFISKTNGAVLVQPGTVAVLGDCSGVSVDSRVWGALPAQNIVGRPLLRIWPLERFGPVADLPSRPAMTTTNADWRN